jgi:hypothetical protein
VVGAGNETRTRDLNLGKVALYQLSYSRNFRKAGIVGRNTSKSRKALQLRGPVHWACDQKA